MLRISQEFIVFITKTKKQVKKIKKVNVIVFWVNIRVNMLGSNQVTIPLRLLLEKGAWSGEFWHFGEGKKKN